MVERIERLLGRIPGYDAYNTRESMRDDDRRVREQIANRLDQAVSDLTRVSSRLAAERQLASIGAVETLVRDVRMLGDRVRSASYGYGGLFSNSTVDELALAQLKSFDVAFDARVEALATEITSIGSTTQVDPDLLRGLSEQVTELDRLFDARKEVITTATPAQDPNVLGLLEQPVDLSPKEQLLLRVRSGGTVAILGDNYQIGAHIIVEGRDANVALSLLRLDDGPQWLAVLNQKNVSCWRVESAEGSGPFTGGQDGKASVYGPKGAQENVPAKYDVEEAGAGSVAIQLALVGDVQTFSGSQVPLIDIEVFSEGKHT